MVQLPDGPEPGGELCTKRLLEPEDSVAEEADSDSVIQLAAAKCFIFFDNLASISYLAGSALFYPRYADSCPAAWPCPRIGGALFIAGLLAATHHPHP
jgi:hypothetical protein